MKDTITSILAIYLLVVVGGCEKESDPVNFRFINSTQSQIDTIYLNNTVERQELVWTKTITNLAVGDTSEYIRFQNVIEPLVTKVICWPNSSIFSITQGNYYPTEESYFDPGSFLVHFSLMDTTEFLIFWSISKE